MNEDKTILVVEDDDRERKIICDVLRHEGYRVVERHNGLSIVEVIKKERPRVVWLDVVLPGGPDGFTVSRQIRDSEDPEINRTPVLILTNRRMPEDRSDGLHSGAINFITKPYDLDDVLANVRTIMNATQQPRFAGQEFVGRTHLLALTVEAGQPVHFSLREKGRTQFEDSTRNLFHYPEGTAELAAKTANGWQSSWRQIGRDLYDRLFALSEVKECYHRALGKVGMDGELGVRISGSRKTLRMPLELLHDGVDGRPGQFLMRKHPFTRRLSGVAQARPPLERRLFDELWDTKVPLRCLLIASNTENEELSSIPEVDKEVVTLEGVIREPLDSRGIPVFVEVIPTAQATLSEVARRLQHGDAHIVHYAGHGLFRSDQPDKSALFFWSKPERGGHVEELHCGRLRDLVAASNVRLMYLSCCQGGAVGHLASTISNDFLGVIDALVQGVPGVLGFSRAVSDEAAPLAAQSFYRTLLNEGDPSLALLEMRKTLAHTFPDSPAFLTNIFVQQD